MRQTIHKGLLVLAMVLATLVCTHAPGDVILGAHDWNPGPEGWSSADTWVTVTDPAVAGVDSWLNIAFDATVEVDGQPEWSTLVSTKADNLFAGTWTSDMFVEFDFWAEDVAPDTLQVQWSSSTNTDVWAYNLTVSPTVGAWTSYTASFANWQDWLFPGATEDQYLSDLSSIDWIGIQIYRTGAGAQSYQLDNFHLMIPEPSQFVMLSSAILVCVAALRRRRGSVHEA